VAGRPDYQVSNFGRVRSDVVNRILKPYLVRGYPTVKINRNGKRSTCYVHNLVLEAFAGPRPPGFQGCHNDGNPLNSMVCNLRWDSVSNNHRDRMRHDINGDRNPMAKLTYEQVTEIRAALAAGGPRGFQSRLARQYGISDASISRMKRDLKEVTFRADT